MQSRRAGLYCRFSMTATFHDRPRRSRSIPSTLVRRGRLLDVPLYYVLRSSDLVREGLDHSGSHRFADHIYRGEASGRGMFGRSLDALLLGLPAARAFRFRYAVARDEIARFVLERLGRGADAIAVLSVACGIPRELTDAGALVREHIGWLPHWISFYGLDLDRDVLAEAQRFAAERGLASFQAIHGDALDRHAYPEAIDFVSCTGLTEFLEDDVVVRLYELLFDVLEPGGCLLTSGMQRRWAADYLLRLGEVATHYRDMSHLRRLAGPLPFRDVRTRIDETGIQTVLIARK
ncbi:MAG: hypothetical protein C5B57_08295 [Blastocatellia bacterium]|nr:MAG: hypothetical protein C5B57_08295 [Blastocatellia bacterium]